MNFSELILNHKVHDYLNFLSELYIKLPRQNERKVFESKCGHKIHTVKELVSYIDVGDGCWIPKVLVTITR